MKTSSINGCVTTRPSITPKRRGLKPGQRHSGQFKPGHDPRRNIAGPFVSERKRSFMQACRDLTDNALDVLTQAMNDESASWRDRMAASALLIEHGHGKAVDRQVVATLYGDQDGRNPEEISTKELLKMVSDGIVYRDRLSSSEVIDGETSE